MDCDPDALAEASECFCGLSEPEMDMIQIYLLCEIANAV